MGSIYTTCKKTLLYVALFSFIMNVITLAVPIYTLQVFDRVLRSQAYDTLAFMSLLVVVMLLFYGILSILRSQILVVVSHWIGRILGKELLENSIEGKLKGSNYTYESLKDLSTIKSFFSGQGIIALFDSPWIFIFLLVMLWFNLVLGLAGLAAALFLYAIAYYHEKSSKHQSLQVYKSTLSNQDLSSQIIDNSPSVISMGMLKRLIYQWDSQCNQVEVFNNKNLNDAGLFRNIVKTSRMIIQVLILGLGASLVVSGQIAPGAMIAASILISRALAPIEQAVYSSKQLTDAWNAFGRLSLFTKHSFKIEETTSLPPPQGNLEVNGVSFAYPGERKLVLQGVSFSLSPGEILVVMGPNGAGKSTLAELVLGVYQPISGTVRLDGAETFQWQRGELGRYTGYLSQSLDLFSGSLKQNICRMDPNIDEEKVIRAARATFLHEQFLQFPNGYDSSLLSKGSNFSMGQKQKIAITRAFYGDPKLIVLDEPTAHLDNEGIQALFRSFKEAKGKNQTLIVVSHHPLLINFADKLLVLQKGSIHHFGPKKEVLEKLKDGQVIRKSKS